MTLDSFTGSMTTGVPEVMRPELPVVRTRLSVSTSGLEVVAGSLCLATLRRMIAGVWSGSVKKVGLKLKKNVLYAVWLPFTGAGMWRCVATIG